MGAQRLGLVVRCLPRRAPGARATSPRSGIAPVYGLNYKDKRDDAIAWLKRFGDPYQASMFDADGRVGIDYGVYGVPETYVIDRQGVIRYKRIGPVTPEIVQQKIAPLIAELNQRLRPRA